MNERANRGGAREGQSVIAAHLACKHESLAWAKLSSGKRELFISQHLFTPGDYTPLAIFFHSHTLLLKA